MITGQVPMATAKDNLFPRIFKKENKKGAPVIGLDYWGIVFYCLVMLMNFTEGLVDQFQTIVEIVVFAALMPYLLTAAAYILILIEKKLILIVG